MTSRLPMLLEAVDAIPLAIGNPDSHAIDATCMGLSMLSLRTENPDIQAMDDT